MLLDGKIIRWLRYGLDLYTANNLLTELVFTDGSDTGHPEGLDDGLLIDTTQRWLPGEKAGGFVRYGGDVFPITGNDWTTLQLVGDPSLVEDPQDLGYRLVSVDAMELDRFFHTYPVKVLETTSTVEPVELPSITVRLQSDTQQQAYIGEIDEQYVLQTTGAQYAFNRTDLTGTYLLSVWTVNRLATLRLYSWLQNWCTASAQLFGYWGIDRGEQGGSDLDPALLLLPEKASVRHLVLSLTRPERALNLVQLERVTSLDLIIDARYATFATLGPGG
jgi:hypothetical protein